jgi:hypothetical protein
LTTGDDLLHVPHPARRGFGAKEEDGNHGLPGTHGLEEGYERSGTHPSGEHLKSRNSFIICLFICGSILFSRINEARDRGDIELLECIAKDSQAFILKQGWASVSLNGHHGLKELRSLYEHLQTRILEMIETLDDPCASGDYQVIEAAEKDETVIVQIVSAQREKLEQEIASLET